MSIIFFYISFLLILTMLGVKYYGIAVIQHQVLHDAVNESEKHFHAIIGKSKEISSKIHFKNARRFTMIIANFLRKEAIYLKRRFDSQQPKFFLKPNNNGSNKDSVSFFLRNISEYKKSLRNKDLPGSEF